MRIPVDPDPDPKYLVYVRKVIVCDVLDMRQKVAFKESSQLVQLLRDNRSAQRLPYALTKSLHYDRRKKGREIWYDKALLSEFEAVICIQIRKDPTFLAGSRSKV